MSRKNRNSSAGTSITGRRKKKKVRINHTRLLLSAIILAVIVACAFSIKNIVDLKIEQSQLKAEKKALLAEKEKLEEELKNVNDLDYIEERARTQLNMIKPGEILYITKDKESKNSKNGKSSEDSGNED